MKNATSCYNTKYKCRYHKDDVFLETDDVNEQEKDFIRDILYKEDVLNIFSIEVNENTGISENVISDVFENVISELYNKIKDCIELKICMKKMAANLFSQDYEFGLTLMYCYDYMYITHKCVSEYLDTGSLSDENIKLLSEISK